MSSECVDAFQAMKLRKKSKYIIFNLNKEKTEIIVEKVSPQSEYEAFLGDLPEAECRWGVFDLEYDTDDGKRTKLVFIHWYVIDPFFSKFFFLNKKTTAFFFSCYMYIVLGLAITYDRRSPDSAKIKDKMLAASSREALRRSLVGIHAEVQASEYSEVDFETGTFPPFTLSEQLISYL